MDKSIIVVPARGGSKGIKHKNLQEVLGLPLVIRSLVHAQFIATCSTIILSTDSLEIVNAVEKYFEFRSKKNNSYSKLNELGTFKLHLRSSELADDTTLITEVLFDIRTKLEYVNVDPPTTWCLLQPTSPFRSKSELKIVNEILDENTSQDFSLVSVCPVNDMHPARMYTVGKGGKLISLPGFKKFRHSRRQDLIKVYIRDGGFYLMGDNLVRSKQQYTVRPNFVIRDRPWSMNIDSQEQLLISKNTDFQLIADDPNEYKL